MRKKLNGRPLTYVMAVAAPSTAPPAPRTGLKVASRAADAPAAGAAEQFRGITKPSEDRTLNFNHPGRMSNLNVKLGDTVKAGDPIAQQDMTVELAQLEADKAKAANDTEEKAEI